MTLDDLFTNEQLYRFNSSSIFFKDSGTNIYLGKRIIDNEDVLIKAERPVYQIFAEKNNYQKIGLFQPENTKTQDMFPVVYDYFPAYGSDHTYYLVMEKLGKSFDHFPNDLLNNENMKKIALRCIDILEKLHNNKLIHSDVKPGNIVFRENTNLDSNISFIDLGVAVFSKKNDDYNCKGQGTPFYKSIFTYKKGYACNKHMDIEGLGFTLYHLCSPLHWIAEYNKITTRKEQNTFMNTTILEYKQKFVENERSKLSTSDSLYKFKSNVLKLIEYCQNIDNVYTLSTSKKKTKTITYYDAKEVDYNKIRNFFK
jgi:serine/threonine protein kinase